MKTNLISFCAAALTASAVCGAPTVSNVRLSQDADTREVSILYDLDEEAIVVAEILTNGASVGWANLRQMAGDVNRITPSGADRRIRWRPDRSWPDGGVIADGEVTAKLVAHPRTDPPDYMVADLSGTGMRFYYPSEDALPRAIDDRLYRTELMVFRRIRAAGATFRMGLPWYETGYSEGKDMPRRVSLTNDFYLGVFPVTQGQAAAVDGASHSAAYETTPSYSGEDAELCPLDNLSANSAGLGYASRKGIDDYSLESGGILKSFRDQMKDDTILLPTIAEWTFACQAGSEEPVYGSLPMEDVAWYAENSDGRVHPVGLKAPNAFGLYDMLGNVWERTRESGSVAVSTTDQIAPFGASASHGGYNMMLGGAFDSSVVNYGVRKAGSTSAHSQYACEPGWGIRLYIPLR